MAEKEARLSEFHLPLGQEARSRLAYLARYYEQPMPRVGCVLLTEAIDKEFTDLVVRAVAEKAVTKDEAEELLAEKG